MTTATESLSSDQVKQKLTAHQSYLESKGREGQCLDLSHYVIENFQFDGLDLSEVVAQGARFKNCSFKRVNWSGGNLDSVSAQACSFDDAILVKAEFFEANLAQSTFVGANLNRAEFIECDLSSVNFENAQMAGAVVAESRLTGASFEGVQKDTASFDNNEQ